MHHGALRQAHAFLGPEQRASGARRGGTSGRGHVARGGRGRSAPAERLARLQRASLESGDAHLLAGDHSTPAEAHGQHPRRDLPPDARALRVCRRDP